MQGSKFTVDVVVQIPRSDQSDLVMDEGDGRAGLDPPSSSYARCPVEYGYVNNTLADDGEPVDIMVLSASRTFPGCIIETRIVGVLEITHADESNHLLLGVAAVDPEFQTVQSIADVSPKVLDDIVPFLDAHRKGEGKPIRFTGWKSVDEADVILNQGIAQHKK